VQKIETTKKDFDIFNGKDERFVYLDTAASSQTPTAVLDAMNEYYQEYRSNIHRGVYKLSEIATEKYEGARKTLATFLGALPEEIIFRAVRRMLPKNSIGRKMLTRLRVYEGAEHKQQAQKAIPLEV